MTPLNKLVSILAPIMGKEVDDPEVLKAAVDVVMAIREPSEAMIDACHQTDPRLEGMFGIHAVREEARREIVNDWKAMIDALLTEGG